MRYVALAFLAVTLLGGCAKSGEDCIEASARIVGPLRDLVDALSGAELLANRQSLDGKHVDTVGTLVYEVAGYREITGERTDLVLVYLDDVALRTGWPPGAVALRLFENEMSKAKAMSGMPVRVLGLFRSKPVEFSNVPEPAGEITQVIVLQPWPVKWPERQTFCPPQEASGVKSGAVAE